jgi:hypothetical protein
MKHHFWYRLVGLNYILSEIDNGGLLLNKSSETVAALCEKDEFLNYICDTYQSGMCLGAQIYSISFSDYGEVEVTLPEGVNDTKEVEDFSFMTEGFIESLDKFWEW